eukprot:403344248
MIYQQNQQGAIKLYYFDSYGRGEPIRMIFYNQKVPFEDIRLTWGDFKNLREQEKFEFKQVPVLELQNGKCYAQSQAIMRMMGRAFGLYPIADKDAQEAQNQLSQDEIQKWNNMSVEEKKNQRIKAIKEGYEIDSILQANSDLIDQNWWLEIEKSSTIKERMMDQYIIDLNDYFKGVNGRLEKLSEDAKFIVGNRLTIADFDAGSLGYTLWLNPNNKFYELHQKEIQMYPRLIKYYQDFREQFIDYFNNRNSKLPY